jgi:hypothetical protein
MWHRVIWYKFNGGGIYCPHLEGGRRFLRIGIADLLGTSVFMYPTAQLFISKDSNLKGRTWPTGDMSVTRSNSLQPNGRYLRQASSIIGSVYGITLSPPHSVKSVGSPNSACTSVSRCVPRFSTSSAETGFQNEDGWWWKRRR